ncbi:MAG: CYTH domain-containing protein, partial [Hyphomonadaceae bacterium]
RGPRASVRVRLLDGRALLTIKSAEAGAVRSEFEYEIPFAHAEELLQRLCEPPLIEKVRHDVEAGGRLWTVDVFEGALVGLVMAEIELNAADEAIDIPVWAGREVTHDAAYRNEALALRDAPPALS